MNKRTLDEGIWLNNNNNNTFVSQAIKHAHKTVPKMPYQAKQTGDQCL